MEKLKILHVVETLAVEAGGGDRACAELAEAQAQNGHEVTLLCTKRADRPTTLRIEGVNVIEIETGGLIGRKLSWSPVFYRRLKRQITQTDIVHCHGTWRMIQVYVRWACLAQGVPYVHQPHGSFAPVKLRHRKWLKRMWGVFFEIPNLRAASALHAETQADLTEIDAYYRHPCTYVLPCGSRPTTLVTDLDRFSRNYPQLVGERYVLYLGRLDVQKGVNLLIDAFATVYADEPETHLVIVGPDYNNTKVRLQRQAKNLSLDNVLFLPPVDEDDKHALYANASCFVFPSHAENFGITVLEALLADCPVLVSRNTGWAALERDGGGLVFNPTEADISGALRRFRALTPGARAEMIRRGREIAAEYDWRAIAQRQDAIYADILLRAGKLE